MSPETGFRTAADGTQLFRRHWTVAEPRAAVVIVHGIAEHGGRYDHVGAGLAAAGFDVRVSDLRGFGVSEGRRAWVDAFDDYLDDLVPDITDATTLSVPVVLLGHSLGGLIAFLYAVSDRPAPDLLVLSAPAIEARIPMVKRVAARVMHRVAPRISVSNGLEGSQLSTDPTVGDTYFADPLVHPKTTAALGVESMDAMSRAQELVDSLAVPTLVIHGAEDTIVPASVSAPFVGVAERRVFPGFRHESFNEGGGVEAIEAVVSWIDRQLAAET